MAEEVAARRAALLKKFRLESDKIPIRLDFKKEKVRLFFLSYLKLLKRGRVFPLFTQEN